jgi:hypothetical protein
LAINFVTVKRTPTKAMNDQPSRSAKQSSKTSARPKADTSPIEIASTEFARKVNRDVVLRLVRSRKSVRVAEQHRLFSGGAVAH